MGDPRRGQGRTGLQDAPAPHHLVMPSEHLPDVAAVEALARRLAPRLRPGDRLLLDGPMGAGKTTLTRALVAALGGDPEQVSSPTFTLMHHYAARIPLIHVDAYRLGDADELAAIGFDEQLEEGAVACVEWPSRVAGLFVAEECWRIALDHHDVAGRTATIVEPVRRDQD